MGDRHLKFHETRDNLGSWVDQSTQFYYATTFDFRRTDLDKAIRKASDRLQTKKVEFIPWDAERINEMLRDRPRLVERFFGVHWVEPFCGKQALLELAHDKLDATETRLLRTELHGLYRAAFDAVASIKASATGEMEAFVILDVMPRPDATMSVGGDAGGSIEEMDQVILDESAVPLGEAPSVATSALGRSRRSLRSVRTLLDDRRGPTSISDAVAADVWAAEGERNLLIGGPGAGKSRLLRFIAMDLLATAPGSVALQRHYGERLPVWLPFGFFCHHLDANDSNSLTSAVKAWLDTHSRPDLYQLVARALEDDRLLLLIDGIDEWTTESSANKALARLETFLGSHKAAVILTSRPYAVARLPFSLTWRRADMAPLDADQQRRIARQYLIPGDHISTPEEGGTTGAIHAAMWSTSNVEPFIAQLNSASELQSFATTPLLLALLARSWQGEPLPPRRFELYDHIVRMLVDTHPKMRSRASNATDQPLTTNDFLTLIQAVAYRLKVDGIPQPVPSRTMQRLIESSLADPDIMDYGKDDARRMAAEAMSMAEDEFGILVPQGAKHVGFIHRVIGDHLAGRRLAELEPQVQLDTFAATHGDPAWADALLAALHAQPNRHIVASSLDAIVRCLEVEEESGWPYGVLRMQATWRFVAGALASDLKLTPTKTHELLDRVIREVDSSPSLMYRAALLTSLVEAGSTSSGWRRLHPVFRRWLDASRPNPVEAMLALRKLPTDLDDRVRGILLKGMRHDDADVRAGAVDAFVARYGNSKAIDSLTEARPVDPDLLEVIKVGPDARAQTAALMALVEGWPHDEVTWEHVEWARRTPKANLRTAALFALAGANPTARLEELLEPAELGFIMEFLYQEALYIDDHDWTGMNSVLVTRYVSESSDHQKDSLAEFAAMTLRQNPLGPGSRRMCWELACGPPKSRDVLRDWVLEELTGPNENSAPILYDLSQMPQSWLEYQPMKDAISDRIGQLLGPARDGNSLLTRALGDDSARTVLLQAIDGFRPESAARELVTRFGDDPVVVEELNKRFAIDDSAAPLAGIAIRHLGPAQGFARIYGLLQKFNAIHPASATEPHVVVTLAVAQAWHSLRRAAAGQGTELNIDPLLATEVLSAYDEAEIAATCIAVPTRRGLGWHIAEIIHTWPSLSVDYALAELENGDRMNSALRLPDPVHAAVISAHADRPSPRSQEVLDIALGLLTPLPPELREVLTHELSRAPIPPVQLLDVTRAWISDPDDGVRRHAAIGITQAVLRNHQPESPSIEFSEWREKVQSLLCAYGPSLEEDRQIAWTCMLLLKAPELLDGQLETIGEPAPPCVRLADIHGNTDELLVELIAQNWESLLPHLHNGSPLRQLTGERRSVDADETRAVRHLLSAAAASPGIAALIQKRIDTEIANEAQSHTQELLETTPSGIDYLITTQGRTIANLRRVVNAADGESPRDRDRERWAFERLTDRWEIQDDELQAILSESTALEKEPEQGSEGGRTRGIREGSVVRAALDFLYPQSEVAQSRLSELVEWFARPTPQRGSSGAMTWIEALVLTFLSGPNEQLPLLIERVFDLHRLEVTYEPRWKFTTPVMRRLANDPVALSVLRGALTGATPNTESSLWESHAPWAGADSAAAARRVFLIARIVKSAGKLSPEEQGMVSESLRKADSRTVVADPFTGAVGPLRTLGVSLYDGLDI